MDQESLGQIKHIVTEATEAVEGRLRQEIQQTEGRLHQEIQQTENRLGQEIQQTDGRLRGEIEDVKRHTGVLVEHLEDKISLLVEGQQAVRQYLEDFRSEIQSETKETRALRVERKDSGLDIRHEKESFDSMSSRNEMGSLRRERSVGKPLEVLN